MAAEDSTLYLRGFVYDTSDSSHGMNLVAYDISDPTQPLFKIIIPMSFRTENPFWMRHDYFFCFSENSVYVGKIVADSSTAQMVGKFYRLPIVDYSLIGSKAFLVLTNGELVILDIRIPENLKCLGIILSAVMRQAPWPGIQVFSPGRRCRGCFYLPVIFPSAGPKTQAGGRVVPR